MNVKINIAEVSNPDPMYSGLRAQFESKKCYVVVELIVVVTTYKPLLIPTTISSFRSKTPLSKSTTQLEAVLKFVDSKCDFGLQIWRCNSLGVTWIHHTMVNWNLFFFNHYSHWIILNLEKCRKKYLDFHQCWESSTCVLKGENTLFCYFLN